MSPHGNKLWEFAKFAANRLIPDGIRRRLKSFGAAVQRLPVKLLGLEGRFERQRAEIERLKSRLVGLDGKLNLALYGVPRMDEYHAAILAQPLLFQLPAAKPSRELDPPALGDLKPASTLLLGLGYPLPASNLGRVTAIDLSREQLEAFQKTAAPLEAALATDLVSGLMALANRKFELILCRNALQQLAPREQSQVLALATQRLAPGGALVVDLPDLSQPDVAGDLYWADERNLRPYSRRLILDTLREHGTVESSTIGRSWRVRFTARK